MHRVGSFEACVRGCKGKSVHYIQLTPAEEKAEKKKGKRRGGVSQS